VIVHCRLDNSWTFFSFLLAGCLVMTRLLTFAHPIDRIHMFDTTMKKILMAGRSDSGQIFQICDIPAANLWTLVLIVPRWILMV